MYGCVFSGKEIHRFDLQVYEPANYILTKTSSSFKVTYILNSNTKLVILLENIVKIWIPFIRNVKYLPEKKFQRLSRCLKSHT